VFSPGTSQTQELWRSYAAFPRIRRASPVVGGVELPAPKLLLPHWPAGSRLQDEHLNSQVWVEVIIAHEGNHLAVERALDHLFLNRLSPLQAPEAPCGSRASLFGQHVVLLDDIRVLRRVDQRVVLIGGLLAVVAPAEPAEWSPEVHLRCGTRR
jgi:hypothetical protein